MHKFWGQLQQLPDWWFRLCTGHTTYNPLDEELYRQRLLVMTSFFWLLNVGLLTIATPLLIDFTPEGQLSAQVLFVVAALGVLLSILALRHLKSRVLALNVLLVILAGAFSGACLIFGGSQSPTFILMLLVPVAAAIAGNVYIAIFWSAVVLTFWSAMVVAERSGIVFLQIIKPENHSAGMTTAYAALALSVVSLILVYAEMNKRLRTSLQASNIELAHLSAHDQLTGLPNRRFYDKRVNQGTAPRRRAR
ncbi:MAG: GGDEF domain-containing protein [Halioglobus sp.]|nr:GGDEF domain-containing protein [Halioglobus sp.]